MDRCEVARCRAEADIVYLEHGVCEKHWNQLTADDAPPDALRMALGLEAAPVSAMEESTMTDDGSKKATKAEAAATTAPAKSKGTKKAKAPKQAKPKVEKPKRPRIPEGEVCVFAFRLSTKDRDRIHQAAGSGKASGFVLAAALAAADGDVEAFKKVVETRATK